MEKIADLPYDFFVRCYLTCPMISMIAEMLFVAKWFESKVAGENNLQIGEGCSFALYYLVEKRYYNLVQKLSTMR